MIRFGITGIPLSCKGRTLLDAVVDIHSMGLSALEVQFLRLKTDERLIDLHEVGKSPKELKNEIVLEVLKKGDPENISYDINKPLEKEDIIKFLAPSTTVSLANDYEEIEHISKISKDVDVTLHMHSPYYISFTESRELYNRSIQVTKWSLILANALKAEDIIIELGMLSPTEGKKPILKALDELKKWMKKMSLKIKIGVTTTPKKELFGSIDEIFELCKSDSMFFPVLNFSYIYARNPELFKSPEKMQEIISKAYELSQQKLYIQFSGVEMKNNELRLTPLKRSVLKFDIIADILAKNNYEATVISTSPLLEHDAIYMKQTYEKIIAKNIEKKKVIKEHVNTDKVVNKSNKDLPKSKNKSNININKNTKIKLEKKESKIKNNDMITTKNKKSKINKDVNTQNKSRSKKVEKKENKKGNAYNKRKKWDNAKGKEKKNVEKSSKKRNEKKTIKKSKK
jgi:deoxyribonuclease-4